MTPVRERTQTYYFSSTHHLDNQKWIPEVPLTNGTTRRKQADIPFSLAVICKDLESFFNVTVAKMFFKDKKSGFGVKSNHSIQSEFIRLIHQSSRSSQHLD